MNSNITSLKDVFVQTCAEMLPMFGLEHKFMCELPESSLNSGEEINIVIGLTKGLKGNLILCMPKETAFCIVSGMMGGMPVDEINEISKSGISEFFNMLCGNAIAKIQSEELIDISTPTLVIGKETFLMISRVASKKIFFKIGENKFNISYSLE